MAFHLILWFVLFCLVLCCPVLGCAKLSRLVLSFPVHALSCIVLLLYIGINYHKSDTCDRSSHDALV